MLHQLAAATFLDKYEERKSSLSRLLKELLDVESTSLTEAETHSLLDALHSSMEPALIDANRTPESNALAQIRAASLLLQQTVDSIERDVAAIDKSGRRDAATDQAWLAKFKQQCMRKHGIITPPDNTKRTPIPLDDIYVPGRITSDKLEASVTVYDMIDRVDRTVILGTPGGGKSTATNAIAHRLASSIENRVPLVVILRDYAKSMDSSSLANYIEVSIAPRYESTAPPAGLIESILREGKAFVLLDGLDELLDPTARRTMAEKVELFSAAFPSTPLLVTSRKVGYNEAALDRAVFEAVELTSYNEDDVISYTTKWFELNAVELQLDDGKTMDQVCNAFLSESESITELRTNPLLLSLLCIIYRGQNYLPRHRIGVYEKCTELLFETWDRSRGLTYDFDFDDLIEEALKHLAYWIFTNDEGGVGVAEGPLVEEIASFFSEHAYDSETRSRAAAKEFIRFCKGRAWVLTEVGLSPDDEPLFAFVHRTFLEYYAAAQFTRIYPDPQKLALALVKRVARNEWDTAGQLAVQITNRSVLRGAERVLERLMESAAGKNRSVDYRANVLTFVVRCLADMPSTPGLLRKTFAMMSDLIEVNFADDAVHSVLNYSMRALYALDRSGEYVLLTELQNYVDAKIASGITGRRDALRLTASCLSEANGRERRFFRSRFIETWGEGEEHDYDELLTGYFAGCVDADEIVDLTIRRGGAPLDFLFYKTGRQIPPLTDDRYHCVAFAMVASYRIWTPAMFEQFDKESGRWLGTLLEDLEPLMNSITGPFASAGLTQLHLHLDPFGRRRNDDAPVLSNRQWAMIAVLSCVMAEMKGGEPFTETAINSLSVLQDALAAARDGQWGPESALTRIQNDNLQDRLQVWASSAGHGFLRY
ncbi:hypothetical protein DEI89_07735 [Curtobacterium sp. MCBD17_030]|nr:hypothetical protein DEI89_07735 [Curtobacterium sp. MCBD17_030]